MPEKVALIGSGNWGSAIATKLGKNVLEKDDFDSGKISPRHRFHAPGVALLPRPINTRLPPCPSLLL
jgi:hypothetical protein